MKLRMTMATGLVAVALAVLGGCGKTADNTPEPSPNAGTSSSATPPATSTAPPTGTSTPSSAADLVGDWHDKAAQWTMHFHKDGTFIEDFQGLTDFRVGTYKLNGDTISLIGDDGNTDEGTVQGGSLVFRLGTLTKG